MKIKILQHLKNTSTHISGEQISKQLKISRSAIWKNIEELRKDGYLIEATPHLGYTLKSIPDKLLAHEIQDQLQTKFVGKNFVWHDSLESTMSLAFKLGLEGAQEGTVVCAEGQTKGKGRLGRVWNSPKRKGIYLSIILRPSLSLQDVSKLTLLTAVALCEAITKQTRLSGFIKWPNDILMNQKKVSGILTELHAELDQVRFVVIGIGINVNASLQQLPENATSLKCEKGDAINRIALTQEVLRYVENWYEHVLEHGFDLIMKRWKELSLTIGHQIEFVDQNGKVRGKAIDVDEYGGLIIEDHSGIRVKKMSGEVIQL